MIDTELVTRKMTLIIGDLKQLVRLAGMSLSDYLTDAHAEILAERYLERVVGRMIDGLVEMA